ncbi:MAG: Holliday junction resolvase RuvX [Coriobacteriaceae bacterium]|nr:Holliday junction resolvase RuvX [Coriobacteriaceae bacterium]
MRALGLDIGEKRVGVALSDASGRIASPLTVVDAGDITVIERLVRDHEVDIVVVGLPLSLDGTEGPQARSVRDVGGQLARRLPVPVQFHDERLSTTEAARAMAAAGVGGRRARGKVDMVAAAIVLQAFLDSGRTEADDG